MRTHFIIVSDKDPLQVFDGKVGFARKPYLASVGTGAKNVGAVDKIEIRIEAVAGYFIDYFVYPNH